jgi:hypothetical protein
LDAALRPEEVERDLAFLPRGADARLARVRGELAIELRRAPIRRRSAVAERHRRRIHRDARAGLDEPVGPHALVAANRTVVGKRVPFKGRRRRAVHLVRDVTPGEKDREHGKNVTEFLFYGVPHVTIPTKSRLATRRAR